MPDDNGRFTMKIVKGTKGELFAVFLAKIGDYADCPKLDALLMLNGHGAATLRSSSITIDADQSIENIVLRFPFPKCKPNEP